MHHPTDRIANTTAFVTPVVKHWLHFINIYNSINNIYNTRKLNNELIYVTSDNKVQ